MIRDPDYLTQPLYDYDVGVDCPGSFNIEFVVPTDGADEYDKTFLVHVTDSFRVIKITVFRPAPNITREAPSKLFSFRYHMTVDRADIDRLFSFNEHVSLIGKTHMVK